jgi:hypothetical protein
MYGDLQFTTGDHKWKGTGKVYKYKPHSKTWHCPYLVGYTGIVENLMIVHEYLTNPDQSPPKLKSGDCCGLVLTEEHEIYRFENCRRWMKVELPYDAIGSGGPYALGALAAGLSPKEAIKVAMQNDVYTGLGVKGLRI